MKPATNDITLYLRSCSPDTRKKIYKNIFAVTEPEFRTRVINDLLTRQPVIHLTKYRSEKELKIKATLEYYYEKLFGASVDDVEDHCLNWHYKRLFGEEDVIGKDISKEMSDMKIKFAQIRSTGQWEVIRTSNECSVITSASILNAAESSSSGNSSNNFSGDQPIAEPFVCHSGTSCDMSSARINDSVNTGQTNDHINNVVMNPSFSENTYNCEVPPNFSDLNNDPASYVVSNDAATNSSFQENVRTYGQFSKSSTNQHSDLNNDLAIYIASGDATTNSPFRENGYNCGQFSKSSANQPDNTQSQNITATSSMIYSSTNRDNEIQPTSIPFPVITRVSSSTANHEQREVDHNFCATLATSYVTGNNQLPATTVMSSVDTTTECRDGNSINEDNLNLEGKYFDQAFHNLANAYNIPTYYDLSIDNDGNSNDKEETTLTQYPAKKDNPLVPVPFNSFTPASNDNTTTSSTSSVSISNDEPSTLKPFCLSSIPSSTSNVITPCPSTPIPSFKNLNGFVANETVVPKSIHPNYLNMFSNVPNTNIPDLYVPSTNDTSAVKKRPRKPRKPPAPKPVKPKNSDAPPKRRKKNDAVVNAADESEEYTNQHNFNVYSCGLQHHQQQQTNFSPNINNSNMYKSLAYRQTEMYRQQIQHWNMQRRMQQWDVQMQKQQLNTHQEMQQWDVQMQKQQLNMHQEVQQWDVQMQKQQLNTHQEVQQWDVQMQKQQLNTHQEVQQCNLQQLNMHQEVQQCNLQQLNTHQKVQQCNLQQVNTHQEVQQCNLQQLNTHQKVQQCNLQQLNAHQEVQQCNLQQLNTHQKVQQCNLQQLNMHQKVQQYNLQQLNTHQKVQQCNLQPCNLQQCNLQQCNLQQCNLQEQQCYPASTRVYPQDESHLNKLCDSTENMLQHTSGNSHFESVGTQSVLAATTTTNLVRNATCPSTYVSYNSAGNRLQSNFHQEEKHPLFGYSKVPSKENSSVISPPLGSGPGFTRCISADSGYNTSPTPDNTHQHVQNYSCPPNNNGLIRNREAGFVDYSIANQSGRSDYIGNHQAPPPKYDFSGLNHYKPRQPQEQQQQRHHFINPPPPPAPPAIPIRYYGDQCIHRH